MSKLLSGTLVEANVGGRMVSAQFAKEGGTLSADLVYIGNKSQSGLGGLTRSLFKNIMELAKQEGADTVRINAVAVKNAKLEQKLLKDGWEKTTVKVEHLGDLPAYTKTFKVKQ